MANIISTIRPYLILMRLDKPIGSLLLLWPTLWALWIAAHGFPGWRILSIFVLGVVIMRSAGCVINDIADRNFDGQVARTKSRPLATGSVTLERAVALFVFLCLLGLILVLQLNAYTLALSLVGLLLAVIYPFTKRITHLPQLFLGAAYAWSVLMAFAAVNGSLSGIAWLLFAIAVMWPIAYDSIYALMDREDDIKIGIKSTAILFGRWDVSMIFTIQFLVLSGLLIVGWILRTNFYFYSCLCIAFGISLYQLVLMKGRTVSHYYRAFYSNHWLGFLIYLGFFLTYLKE